MDEHRILDYATPQGGRRHIPAWLAAIWLVISMLIWRKSGWWAYVGDGPTRWPKFELPLWIQLSASLIEGLFATLGVYLLYRLVWRIGRRISGTRPRA